ncbi:hypothetical protein HPP92_006853 [Vanilla planifolia]|uniref:Uncharacterized protein n=1 Tax=Vanilla planifolia TaxID=51239 RepID=A0A835RKN7_VANPL|nr:hypothetical protein HPP92_006853 [Vanilla planifolia]
MPEHGTPEANTGPRRWHLPVPAPGGVQVDGSPVKRQGNALPLLFVQRLVPLFESRPLSIFGLCVLVVVRFCQFGWRKTLFGVMSYPKEGQCRDEVKGRPGFARLLTIHDNLSDRTDVCGDASFNYLSSTFDGRIGATMVVTGGRRIRVRLGEGPERRYHIQGRQQEHKLPNADMGGSDNKQQYRAPRVWAPAGGGAANMAFVLGSCLKPDREISKISGSQMEGRWPRSQQRRVGCHAA